MSLTEVIYRMATNSEFLQQLRTDPQAALKQAELCLEPDAYPVLLSLLQNPGRIETLLSGQGAQAVEPDWQAGGELLPTHP